ncbi:MAG TPA: TolC family protein [bacterium (Candidatus Stahlbacteria)]|nr:TolC family protein [Candidatus Stahlbacteria bacterium]
MKQKGIILIIFLLVPLSTLYSSDKESLVLTLDEAIELALEHNKGILVAREKIKEAECGIITAKAGFLPSLSWQASYTRIAQIPEIKMQMPTGIDTAMVPVLNAAGQPTGDFVPLPVAVMEEGTFSFGEPENYVTRATLQQPIFTWGRIRNAYSLAQANLKAAQADYKKAVNDLKFDVAQSFYRVILAKELAKLAEDSYVQFKRHVDQVEDLYNAGMASKFDLLRARVQLANMKPQIIRAKNGLELAESVLKILLGIDLSAEINLEGELNYESYEITLAEATEIALQKRPELIAMKYRKRMAEHGLAIAEAANKPTIFLTCNYDYKKPKRMLETGWGSDWNVTVGLSLPIFTGFSYFGKVRQAAAQLGQVKLGVKQLVDGIKLEVKQAILDLEQNKEILEAQKDNVTQAKEALNIAEERYKNGLITNLEYMDTQLALTKARIEYLQALADYLIARAQLERAIGR